MKICACLMLGILSIFWSGNAVAKEIKVPDDFGTIQAAVNAAAFGDSVFVKAGTYRECVELKSDVELRGSGASKTIIVPPEGKNRPIITVEDAQGVKDMGAFPLTGKAVYPLNRNITTWGMMKRR